MPIISPIKVCSSLFVVTYRFCLLFAISFHCLFILNEGFEIREIPWRKYVVILLEGGDPFGAQLPDMVVFKKSYSRYRLLTQQFVIRNIISWICKKYFMGFSL